METLKIKAFYFNAKTDYLPYYKSFEINIDEKSSIKELLEAIEERDIFFNYPKDENKILINVNDTIFKANDKVEDIIKLNGNEFIIDSISRYRAVNGLEIDDSSFYDSLELLKEYCNSNDINFYESLYDVHFASSTFDYVKNYIGDAILILAHRLIDKNPDKKAEILEAISKDENGLIACEYENRLYNSKDYSNEINELKKEALKEKTLSLLEKLEYFGAKEKNFVLDESGDLNIALYIGKKDYETLNSIQNLIEKSSYKFINFNMSTKLAGQSIYKTNPHLSIKKASKMLLDAYDSGADTLLFVNEDDYNFFKNIMPKAEIEAKREIGLSLFKLSDFKEKLKTTA